MDLAAFHAEHGRLPLSTREEERGLALWLINKRMSFKDGTMPQDEIELLSAVPGALSTRKNADPDAMLTEAEEWCARHGHIPRASFADTGALSLDEEKERTIAAWMRNHARESSRAYEPSEYAERRSRIASPSQNPRRSTRERRTHSQPPCTGPAAEANSGAGGGSSTGADASRAPA